MNDFTTFKGSITVRSTAVGFGVRFKAGTDAHDLGHALAAIITHYVDIARKADVDCDLDELREMVVAGIHCGMENNLEPLIKH